jgi:hypothetical protein
MDLVLGLSMTSTAVRWVLVDGTTGEGAPMDRGALDTAETTLDADRLLETLLDDENLAESTIHAIGVTWANDADSDASTVLDALEARGLENVVAVSEIEAAEALATGIAEIAGYDDVAVCIFEPEGALVATLGADGVTVERNDRPLDSAEAVDLTSTTVALDLNDRALDAIFVVGSADLDPIVSTLEAVAAVPVISAAEADMAMARGAAVASAQAVNALDAELAPVRRFAMSRTGALTSVLAAAVVVFIVSLSVALGLQLTADPAPEEPQIANAAQGPAPVASPPSVAQAAPKQPRPAASAPGPPAGPPPNARQVVALKMVVAAPPPVYRAPAYEPPAAAPVAPPPAAPPAPAYVPPRPAVPAVPPQPRLRDRIIERIPIINRFHEPEYPYPQGNWDPGGVVTREGP